MCFISMYSVLNTLSEYTYFYISKDITLYTFLLVFKIIESLQCILKEINRLISKGMSNIYLKVTIEKKWRTQMFDYQSLKSLSPGQSLGSPNSRRYYWIFELKNQSSGSKTVSGFLSLWFWKELWRFKARLSLNKIINFNRCFREMNVVFQLI